MMKRIHSVLIWLIVLQLLSGCSTTKQLEVYTRPVERQKLNLTLPDPVKLEPVQWRVITEKNVSEVLLDVKDSNGNVFLVALTEKDYKNLILNNGRILRYVREEKAVIAACKKYYESEEVLQAQQEIEKAE